MSYSWKLGRIAGIPVYVHWTFSILIVWVIFNSWLRTGDLLAALGEQPGDLDRMRKIRVARLAQLRAVRFHRIDIGTVQHRLVRVRIVGFDQIDKVRLPHHRAAIPIRW